MATATGARSRPSGDRRPSRDPLARPAERLQHRQPRARSPFAASQAARSATAAPSRSSADRPHPPPQKRAQPGKGRRVQAKADARPPAASPAGSPRARRSRARGATPIRPAPDAPSGCPPRRTRTDRPRPAPPPRRPRSASTGRHVKGHRPGARPRAPAPTSARCRGPPKMTSARASASRLAGDRPAGPSSPSPIRVSQGSAMTRILLSRRHDRGEPHGRAPSPRRAWPASIPTPAGPRRRWASRSTCASAASAGWRGWSPTFRPKTITHVVDATHPFAAQMSRNAVAACTADRHPADRAGTRALGARPKATAGPASPTLPAAVAALDGPAQRVFLAIGRQHLDAFAAQPQHHYLLRLVDPPTGPLPLPMADVVVARGPFSTWQATPR